MVVVPPPEQDTLHFSPEGHVVPLPEELPVDDPLLELPVRLPLPLPLAPPPLPEVVPSPPPSSPFGELKPLLGVEPPQPAWSTASVKTVNANEAT